MGMLSSFLRSLSCPSRSAAEIPFWHSRMRWKMSMMLSLESPGESRPRERRNFLAFLSAKQKPKGIKRQLKPRF